MAIKDLVNSSAADIGGLRDIKWNLIDRRDDYLLFLDVSMHDDGQKIIMHYALWVL